MVHSKCFNSRLIHDKKHLYADHFYVPDDVLDYYRSRDISRVMCCINNGSPIHTAFTPAGEGRYFIKVNKEIRKKLDIRHGDTLTIELWPDTSRYGMPIADEMLEMFAQEADFDRYFHLLTEGKQRNLIHIINGYKSANKRIEKLTIMSRYLMSVQGKLDFKELNQAFKNGL